MIGLFSFATEGNGIHKRSELGKWIQFRQIGHFSSMTCCVKEGEDVRLTEKKSTNFDFFEIVYVRKFHLAIFAQFMTNVVLQEETASNFQDLQILFGIRLVVRNEDQESPLSTRTSVAKEEEEWEEKPMLPFGAFIISMA